MERTPSESVYFPNGDSGGNHQPRLRRLRVLRLRCDLRHFLRGPRGELESDFVTFQLEIRGEGLAFFRDEAREQIGLAVAEKLHGLLGRDLLLQDRLAHAHGLPRLVGGDAEIRGVGLVNGRAICLAEHLGLRDVGSVGAVLFLVEVELGLELLVEDDGGREGASQLAAPAGISAVEVVV